jgi:hypothetical protein
MGYILGYLGSPRAIISKKQKKNFSTLLFEMNIILAFHCKKCIKSPQRSIAKKYVVTFTLNSFHFDWSKIKTRLCWLIYT